MVLVHPTYFSTIFQYVQMVQSDGVVFEIEDNFQKQTFRNRCYINTAHGKHLLNVPIQHTKGVKQKTKDVRIDYKDDWNKVHLKSLETAYNSSPFFEFYIDDLRPILEKRHLYLIDLNLKCHDFVMDALQLNLRTEKTSMYDLSPPHNDMRNLVNAKGQHNFELDRYIQVFEQNHGFIPNLSILDLIFMEGPNALNYLESQAPKI